MVEPVETTTVFAGPSWCSNDKRHRIQVGTKSAISNLIPKVINGIKLLKSVLISAPILNVFPHIFIGMVYSDFWADSVAKLDITDDAFKRGYSEEDIRHVIRNYLNVERQSDGITMYSGFNFAGRRMEVGVAEIKWC
ncbi:MAG: hypothetical protein LBB58_02745 [Cellulomonadaceae bacterium]|nr:hypothetical protein [Cellulomonadaceae bacterium]